jgi:hypothetical protein
VISAQVLSNKGNSVDFQIEDVLRGTEYAPEVRVWMKTGELCRPEVSTFPTGSRWVMALNRLQELAPGGFNPNTPNISHGRVGDYSLSSCGGYWLALTEDLVTGNLAAGTRWEMDPKMNPVILGLVESFVQGKIDAETLLEASRFDPTVRDMMNNTRSFIREQSYQPE